MTERNVADEMIEKLRPLASENPMAARLMLRVMEAEDPDAEALKVMDEFAALCRLLNKVLAPVVDGIKRFAAHVTRVVVPVVEAWKAEGIEAAERHANGPRQ
jgi:hypothetical protein